MITLLFGAALGLLSGCATLNHSADEDINIEAWRAYQSQAERVTHWHARGKIGISHKQKHWSLNFDWAQGTRRYRIDLSSLFGHAIQMTGLPSKVYIRHRQQPPLAAETPEQALHDLLGISAPITLLQYWIKGIPAPQTPVTTMTIGQNGLAKAMEQKGWRVRYLRWHNETEHRFPKHLIIEGDDIKLVIWITVWDNIRHSKIAA